MYGVVPPAKPPLVSFIALTTSEDKIMFRHFPVRLESTCQLLVCCSHVSVTRRSRFMSARLVHILSSSCRILSQYCRNCNHQLWSRLRLHLKRQMKIELAARAQHLRCLSREVVRRTHSRLIQPATRQTTIIRKPQTRRSTSVGACACLHVQ